MYFKTGQKNVRSKENQDKISGGERRSVFPFSNFVSLELRLNLNNSIFSNNTIKNSSFHIFALDGNFAQFKNQLSKFATGDYIFQIDADEIPDEDLISALPEILETNSAVEVMLVPRINTVEGLTETHIKKWGWNINEFGWVNWPDYQWRIYKNTSHIKWKNKVHEVLEGHKTIGALPPTSEFALIHSKTIERQEKQNNYYETI